MKVFQFVAAALVGSAAVGVAVGANISTGLYELHNHPDGVLRPPLYGLRLDELFDITPGNNNDDYTFDFDHASSNMSMFFTGSTIHIYGQSWGGRDVGSAYANDIYRGIYQIDFTYNIGVTPVPLDDDIYVELPPYLYNTGTITAPASAGGVVIPLHDGHYTVDGPDLDFRLGDESNNQGHRGFNGISGWGWLFHGPENAPYYESSDWLFTAVPVPAPASVGVLCLAGVLAGRRRR
jgi:hypothetical protein